VEAAPHLVLQLNNLPAESLTNLATMVPPIIAANEQHSPGGEGKTLVGKLQGCRSSRLRRFPVLERNK